MTMKLKLNLNQGINPINNMIYSQDKDEEHLIWILNRLKMLLIFSISFSRHARTRKKKNVCRIRWRQKHFHWRFRTQYSSNIVTVKTWIKLKQKSEVSRKCVKCQSLRIELVEWSEKWCIRLTFLQPNDRCSFYRSCQAWSPSKWQTMRIRGWKSTFLVLHCSSFTWHFLDFAMWKR